MTRIARENNWAGILYICICSLLILSKNISAQETRQFPSEAKKMEYIRKAVKNEKHIELRKLEGITCDCDQMLKDLLANREFKAVEPILRTNSKDDPRLAEWSRCEKLDHSDLGVDVFAFFNGLDLLGMPPYRFYRIDFDGNPGNGLEDVVYHNGPGEGSSMGETGYTWVHLERCEKKDRFYATGSGTLKSRKKNAAYLNTLVGYKGSIFLLDYVEGFDISLMRRIDQERIETCLWIFFEID